MEGGGEQRPLSDRDHRHRSGAPRAEHLQMFDHIPLQREHSDHRGHSSLPFTPGRSACRRVFTSRGRRSGRLGRACRC